MTPPPPSLSPTQAHALFDILTHHESYAEIQALKKAEAIANFGLPLQPKNPPQSSSPLLQILLQKFITVLPGLRDVSADFWETNITGLATALDHANLSESYDKGSIGIRKTLSTAIASIVEYVARGVLGGFPRNATKRDAEYKYDTSNPDDVIAAWDEFLQQIIYGDLLDRMFVKAAQTDKLSDHEPLVQAAHVYAFVILGSFLHYILMISPRGQSILPLLVKAHSLSPYFLIRQTLRVGNAASMLNGMVKLVLAKMNMSAVTTWFGGQALDSGMNLLQQIISQILSGDSRELKKRAKAIEQDNEAPSKAHLAALKDYGSKPAEEQQSIQHFSETNPESLPLAILSNAPNLPPLTTHQQSLALSYLSIQLAIRDREQLIAVLCHSSPDLLTQSLRSIIPAYDPIIRALHNAADLSGGVSDLEAFLNDLIKVSTVDEKNKNPDGKPPTVEDYVTLLQKHQGSSHKFIHQVLKNGAELSTWYHTYASHASSQYRQTNAPNPSPTESENSTAAGDFTPHLHTLLSTLPATDITTIQRELSAHSAYLSTLTAASNNSMRTIMQNLSAGKSETTKGPGMYLSRWQALMDETPITPAVAGGAVRNGESESVKAATSVDIDGEGKAKVGGVEGVDERVARPPEVGRTVELLKDGFREVLRGLVNSWGYV